MQGKYKTFGIADRIKVATWNVREMTRKEEEPVRELYYKRHIDFAAITETEKFKGKK